jgi:hypothetical protein
MSCAPLVWFVCLCLADSQLKLSSIQLDIFPRHFAVRGATSTEYELPSCYIVKLFLYIQPGQVTFATDPTTSCGSIQHTQGPWQ